MTMSVSTTLEPGAGDEIATTSMKILIIEDNILQCELMRQLFERLISRPLLQKRIEVVIEIVTTLAEGLSHAESANATIIDLGLPDSDVLNTISSLHRFRPPVIVMTGHDDPDLIASCKANGAHDVFVKGQIHGLCSAILGAMIRDIRPL